MWRSNPNTIILTPDTLFLSPGLHLWPPQEFPTVIQQKKRKLSPDLQRVLDVEVAALQFISRTSLRGNGEERASQWTELQAVHLVIHFAWKDKWPGMYILIHESSSLARGLETWKECFQNWLQENLGKRHMDTPLNGPKKKKMWRYLHPLRMLISSAEEDVKNQVDRMTHSGNTNQSFFPDSPVIAKWTHESSSHGGRDWGYNWTSSTDFHSLRWTWLRPILSTHPVCQQQRPVLNPWYGTILQVVQSATW